jgi:hypothetical protein
LNLVIEAIHGAYETRRRRPPRYEWPARLQRDTLPTMNAPRTRAAEGLPRRAFTVRDVERMAEIGLIGDDERVTVVLGDLDLSD